MRVIHRSIWNDFKWRKHFKNIEERYFWLYLLTCTLSKACGIFYLPVEIMNLESKIPEERISEYLKHLKSVGMLEYSEETEEILIYNFPRYNIIRLGKPMEDCLKKELSLVKNIELIKKMTRYLENFVSTRVNDKKISIISNIIPIYINSINTNNNIKTNTNNETCNDTLIDREELLKGLE